MMSMTTEGRKGERREDRRKAGKREGKREDVAFHDYGFGLWEGQGAFLRDRASHRQEYVHFRSRCWNLEWWLFHFQGKTFEEEAVA